MDDAWYYKDNRSCAFSPSFHHQSGTSDGGAGGKCTPGINSRLEDTHYDDTVDGKNPSPVDRRFIPLFTRFCTSQVVQDFFHQQ